MWKEQGKSRVRWTWACKNIIVVDLGVQLVVQTIATEVLHPFSWRWKFDSTKMGKKKRSVRDRRYAVS